MKIWNKKKYIKLCTTCKGSCSLYTNLIHTMVPSQSRAQTPYSCHMIGRTSDRTGILNATTYRKNVFKKKIIVILWHPMTWYNNRKVRYNIFLFVVTSVKILLSILNFILLFYLLMEIIKHRKLRKIVCHLLINILPDKNVSEQLLPMDFYIDLEKWL